MTILVDNISQLRNAIVLSSNKNCLYIILNKDGKCSVYLYYNYETKNVITNLGLIENN
jgi:hypothetical protein